MDVIGYKLKPKFERMSFQHAMNTYGCDKPDLRFDLKLLDVSDIFKNVKSEIFQKASIKMLNFEQSLSSKEIKVLEEIALKNKAEKIIAIKIADGKFNENNLNTIITNELNEVIKKFKITNSTLIFVADQLENVNQSLGAIRTKANELFNYANEDEYKFV
jgi:aspartyl-tRNA synthetase